MNPRPFSASEPDRRQAVDCACRARYGPPPANAYLQIAGTALRYRGQTVWLRGVNFNNEPALYWQGGRGTIDDINVGEADYAQLESWRANHVRFGMSFSWYTANRTRFFAVLDQHVAWARAHHLWFIPLLFTTPSDCYEGYSTVCGIWSSPVEQEALKAFWVDVAGHYAHEPVVAGYDLLNEPTAPDVGAQWVPLAQRIRDAVRTVDPNHFVVIESGSDSQFSKTLGPNVVYSVHGYAPLSLTHNSCCSYPGPAPDWDGTIRNWNHDSIGQMMLDRMSIRWSQQANVPLWIGEWGTHHYSGYERYLADNIDLMNNVWHVHYAHFVWRSGANDFGLYMCGGFGCPDTPAINAVRPGFAGNVMR